MFRAPKTKHSKQGHPNIGHVLNKRRRKHIKEGPYTKPSATLQGDIRSLDDSSYICVYIYICISHTRPYVHIYICTELSRVQVIESDRIMYGDIGVCGVT